ncbi:unnamed protein product [Caenorhabditis auriculariae]|uniref:Calmodulin-binding domain-containing protein n=2 Tax=Rhabditomorpha TaxID=2301119 RepID=A0A8S1GTK2_9PELO|nr:unnamed protein product [Caenorhabditis auriculariae]
MDHVEQMFGSVESEMSTSATPSSTFSPVPPMFSGRFQRSSRGPRYKYSDTILHTYSCRRSSSIPAPLDRRQGRSCDLHAAEDDRQDRFDNPIAQVSSDILRVSGYTQQFRSLLTARFSPRRESVPNVHLEHEEDDEICGSTSVTADIEHTDRLKLPGGHSLPRHTPQACAFAYALGRVDDATMTSSTIYERRRSELKHQAASLPQHSLQSQLPPPSSQLYFRRSTLNPYSTAYSNAGKFARVVAPQRRFSSVDAAFPNAIIRRSSSKKRRESKNVVHIFSNPYERYVNGGVRFENDIIEEGSKSKTLGQLTKIRRRQSGGYGISISSDSTAKMRCRLRKQLFMRRNRVCDVSVFLAFLGLALVIIDSELTALPDPLGFTKTSYTSLLLRSFCVATTFTLIGCLVHYHAIEVKIALIDSGAEDWRVALSTERVFKLLIEIAVCIVCPFPGSGSIGMPYIDSDTRKVDIKQVPVDVLLSVPMFLRSYLLCRFMVLHSKQFQDAATRSIAALNRISMDFRFVIKTMMADHPLRVLIVFTLSYWICMSWMFTQCERFDGKLEVEHYYLNSMWFIMVTFMSIGYGDIVPNTYCGRTLSITTGIVGAGVSSALIAVISRKLELSRAEKHVNNFMADSKLTNQRKNAAASVLQETWFIHKYKKALHKGDDLRLRHHQRRFLHSINEFRRIKWDQRKLQEKGNSLLDVGKLHSDMHETLWEMHRTQDHFIAQIDILTQKIIELQNTLSARQPCCTATSLAPPSSSVHPATSSAPLLHHFHGCHHPHHTSPGPPSIPRISVGNNGSSSGHSTNGSLPQQQCSVDQHVYPNVTTPLITSFDEV